MEPSNGAATQTLRLDRELWERLEKKALAAGRRPRQEIELRLRQSLAAKPMDRLSPAQALSRLIELHAADVAAYSQSAEEWQTQLTASVPALLGELFGRQTATQDADGFAVVAARALAQKVRRAHLPAQQDSWADAADRAAAEVQPSLAKLQQDELLKIQKALDVGAPEKTTGKRTPGKERK